MIIEEDSADLVSWQEFVAGKPTESRGFCSTGSVTVDVYEKFETRPGSGTYTFKKPSPKKKEQA